MADAYKFGLLVELPENELPRLRNKLVIYFQSKNARGGDCTVEHEPGSRTAVVRFRAEEDQRNVLAKESHQLKMKESDLNMKVLLLPREETCDGIHQKPDTSEPGQQLSADEGPLAEVKGKDGETAEEDNGVTAAVIQNIPKTLTAEFLEMLVVNILRDAVPPVTFQNIEFLPGVCSAVVTFQRGTENSEFVRRCTQNRMFKSKGLLVRPLGVTEQVLVENVENVPEDVLHMYFENEGVQVENVVLKKGKKSAVITFTDHEAVDKITRKKHYFKKKELKVYPYHDSLGTALYGEDRPVLNPPADVCEPIDHAVWRYLSANQPAAEAIRKQLATHLCSVNLEQPDVCLSPDPSILQGEDPESVVHQWTDTVKSAFAQSLAKFKSSKFKLEPDVWDEVVELVRQTLHKEDVVVVPDKESEVLTVAGRREDVVRLEQTVHEVINKTTRSVQRRRLSVVQGLKMTQSVFHILCQNGLEKELLDCHPQIQISFKAETSELMITGLREEILPAKDMIYDKWLSLKRRNVEVDDFVADLLKNEDPEELTESFLTASGLCAAFDIHAHKIQLLAATDRNLEKAGNHLYSLLKSEFIDVEDNNVLEMPEWQDLITQYENANRELCRKIQIRTKGQQVVVSGNKDVVGSVSEGLTDFLKRNAFVNEDVVVQPNIVVEYIQKHKTSWLEHMTDRVVVSYRKGSIGLSGSRFIVEDCSTLLEQLISSVCFDSLKISKPGVKNFFLDEMYLRSVMAETGCLVQLMDESDVQDGALEKVLWSTPPVYQLQTSDGVEIAVCKADLCSYPVHIVVTSSNQNLELVGGLSGALLKAAGPQLQDECNKIINQKGPLKAGDCEITDAGGALRCKKIIHAVGPSYDLEKPQKSVVQLRRAVKGSLELAGSCKSVALPAISRNLGFPLSVCAVTIVRAVKEHCEDKYDNNTLRRIHLVNDDDAAVQAFEAAVRQEFGNHGVSHPDQTPTQALKSTTAKRMGSVPNPSNQVLTKEGITITLTKGAIEDSTTDGTVNIVGEDLKLTQGAVSKAIYHAAGPQLQALVMAKKTNGTIGDVIVTDGCNLRSKEILHAVAPHWDKGQGTANKVLSDLVRDCLEKAEKRKMSSVSFPAIGTGNLGFPKDLAASLMFDELLAFGSNKRPKHLRSITVVLYPGDTETIQVFTHEFAKRFSDASGSPTVPAPFPQIVSSSGMHEVHMRGAVIQVVSGDITKETTDVIVNSSNDNFSLKSGVSKAILEAAGQAVEDECKTQGAQTHPGIILTQAGNLKCKKILHLAGKTNPVQINKVVKDALQMCSGNFYTSVSIPAIGTGQGKVQAKQVADAMLDAVIDELNTQSTLKTIRIVIFQKPMLDDFHSSLKERAAPESKKKGWWESIGDKLKSYIGGDSPDKPQDPADFVIEPLPEETACFHICGDSNAQVDSAKQLINDLISKEYESNCIPDNAVLSLSDADRRQIMDIQKSLGVSITVERNNGQGTIVIKGLSKAVLQASKEIHGMLKRARDEEALKAKVELARAVAEWQYQLPGSGFHSFDPMTNFQLERALEKKQPTVVVAAGGKNYTVTMPNGPGTDDQGQTIQINRINRLKDEGVPEHWDPMPPNSTCQVFALNAGTPEYMEVLNMFKATCRRSVLKIERIQNLVLWRSLQVKKHDMELRNGHDRNETRLFHGTCTTAVPLINKHGFNRSFAGKNATYYGNGTYFAVQASYSADDKYSRVSQQGEKCVYLCRVLTGDYTLGKEGMIVPPTKGAVATEMYDSVVDNLSEPKLYVIFHDTQAYPEYLITFK